MIVEEGGERRRGEEGGRGGRGEEGGRGGRRVEGGVEGGEEGGERRGGGDAHEWFLFDAGQRWEGEEGLEGGL